MTLPKRWKPVIEEPALPPRVPPRVLVAGLVAVSLPGLSGAEGSKGTMYHTCPFCGVGLLGVVEQTWERVPLYEDGFDPSEGGPAVNEIVSASCPRCKWGGDARYYEAGVLSVQVPVHFHVGAAAGTTGEVYEEYTAYYVAPPSEVDSPTWLLTDWEGEKEVGRFPTLLEAVREALRLLREELGEETEPTCGAGAPPATILQLALE